MQRPNRQRESIALIAVIAVSLCLVSAASRCGNKQPSRSEMEIMVDNMINSKVRENLTAASPEVRATDIRISTFKLVVKLEGEVRSEEEKNRAIQIARDTEISKDGTTQKVKDVDAKDLTVKP